MNGRFLVLPLIANTHVRTADTAADRLLRALSIPPRPSTVEMARGDASDLADSPTRNAFATPCPA
jgi:hypothetical protein